jgi:neutral ceramidase
MSGSIAPLHTDLYFCFPFLSFIDTNRRGFSFTMVAQVETIERQLELQLGAAQAIISPPIGSQLSGFVARTEPMVGVHDDLYVRVLVWSDGDPSSRVALLTLDVIGLDVPTVEKMRHGITARTAIASERIAVTATHTHGGPAVMAGRLGGAVNQQYLDWVIQTTVDTVVDAAADLQPVTARFCIGREETVGKNRRVVDGPIDSDVPVLRFDRLDGQPHALLVSYACHPVTLGADNLQATADYPGYVVRTLETLYAGAHVQFATGCCGQINTGHSAQDSVHGRGLERRTYKESQRLGRSVAAAAFHATEQGAAPGGIPLVVIPDERGMRRIKVARRSVQLPLQPCESVDTLRGNVSIWREEAQQLRQRGAALGDILLREAWADWAERTAAEPHPAQSVQAEVMVFGLGDICIVLLPGEAFVEFGLEIKQRARHPALMVLAYANSNPGYIPHRSAYAQGGYEVVEAYRFYNYPSGFAPEAGELLVSEALRLVQEVTAQ